MKILILTGKFGMGHYQAAQAIKEELENNPKDDIEIIDWIEYLTPGCAKYIYAGYSSLIGHKSCNGIDSRYRLLWHSRAGRIVLSCRLLRRPECLCCRYMPAA